MKAIVRIEYGDVDQLVIQDVEKPAAIKGEVLIRVKAT